MPSVPQAVAAFRRLQPLPPLALYVHVPWCVRKCPYCDFNSHALRPGGVPEREYLEAILDDLAEEAAGVAGRSLETVFFGGGTPSLLSPETVARVLEAARRDPGVRPDAEVTLEANPGTVERGRLSELRAAGVNRLSIGVQSFDDGLLARIGRIHSGEEALVAVEAARAAGFDNLNLDLMYGLPGQTPGAALADLNSALALGPEHVSHYQLTLEPGTPFHRAPPSLPDDEAVSEIESACPARLAEAGYRRYEISAFARPGMECRHNLGYWTFGDYLPVGPGAHGKVTRPDGLRVVRRVRRRHPEDYLRAGAGQRVAEQRELGREDLAFEFFLNALRLPDGVPAGLYSERTGLSLETVAGPLAEARRRGLLADDRERLQPTEEGLRYLNDLCGLFLAPTS
ncbi:MAG: radical SAM family heme chaperone HemW [Gammaproteobacteria bacterium]|nr:radical SAM family heme chaperone HemW [Gammaproteobacteria bacterium]